MLRRDEASLRVIVPDVGGGFGSKGTLPVETPWSWRSRPPSWGGRCAGPRIAASTRSPRRRAAGSAAGWSSRWTRTDASSRCAGRVLADLGAYLLPSTAIPAAHHGDAPLRRVRHPGRRGDRHRGTHEQGPDRAVPRRRATGGDRADRDGDRRRRAGSSASTRSSCAGATSCARSRTGRHSAGRTTRATSSAAWTARSSCWATSRSPDRHTGVGVALAIERSGGLYECAEVTRDGVVRVGSIPAGSGHETLFAQIAAAKLGLGVDQITVLTGDTDALADGVGSFSSRSTAMGGSAVAAAADDLLAGGPASRASPPTRGSRPPPTWRSSTSTRRRARWRCAGSSPSTDAGTILNPLLAKGQVVGGAGRRVPPSPSHRGRDPGVRHRVRGVPVAAEPARREGRRGERHERRARRRSPTRWRT